MTLPTAEQLRAALDAHVAHQLPPLPGRTNHIKTAVMLPLVWQPDDIVCIATVRATTLSKHAGEVCFPGGRPDDSDRDLRHTAAREADEELGLRDADILGELSSVPLYTSDYRIVPYVAAVPPMELVVNEREVASVIRISLREQLAAPHVDGIPWTHDGQTSLSPAFTFADHVMYGGTAHCLYELLIVVASMSGGDAPALLAGRYTWDEVLIT